jgi:hypothetical protein
MENTDPVTGLVWAQDFGKDNEPLFTATYLALIYPEEPSELITFVSRFLDQTRTVVEGLYHRYPGSIDLNSVDNLIGIASMSERSAAILLRRGRSSFWCFNNTNPDKWTFRSWYGRFIGFKPFLKARLNIKLNPWEKGLYYLAAKFSLFSDRYDVGNKILQWLMNREVQRQWPWIAETWNASMLKRYPGGIHELCVIYHGQGHVVTMAAKSWKGKF